MLVTFPWGGLHLKRSSQMSPCCAFRGGWEKTRVWRVWRREGEAYSPSLSQHLCLLLAKSPLIDFPTAAFSSLPGEGPAGLSHFWGEVRDRIPPRKWQQAFAWAPLLGATGMGTLQSLPSGDSGSKRRRRKVNRPVKQCDGRGLWHL